MVNLPTIQAHNASLKTLTPGLVAVFVGGTSGISLSTALALTRYTTSPKIYLIGRSQSAAKAAITTMKAINPSVQPTFIQTDISLLKNVDSVCAQIKAREKRLNILFMTPGYMTMNGRDETTEGLDRKIVLHYYARMRFVDNLLPLLTVASQDTTAATAANLGSGGRDRDSKLSRVISVLDPHVSVRAGGSGLLDFTDLSLKHTFSLKKCGHHASLMGNFYLEGMARRYSGTSFIHAYPSGVATGLFREIPGGRVLGGVLGFLLKPFMVPVAESGERHLFVATSGRFPSLQRQRQREGEGEGDDDVAVGSDGRIGSGCYWVSWDEEVFAPNGKIDRTREQGAVDRVARHTEEVFRRVCEEGGTYS